MTASKATTAYLLCFCSADRLFRGGAECPVLRVESHKWDVKGSKDLYSSVSTHNIINELYPNSIVKECFSNHLFASLML